MSDKRLLVIDNDPATCAEMRTYFENEGYEVKIANDGVEGLDMFRSCDPDLVLLDVVLPKKDGKEVCRAIREFSGKPIIMVSAKNDVFDIVLGLEFGADDYVVKPFDIKELSARVRAVLRRCRVSEREQNPNVLVFDNIEINMDEYVLKINGKKVEIPPKELALIHYLALNNNRVFTRDQLLDKVWGYDFAGDSRTVDVHIKRLREKLKGVSDKWQLKTVWGVGYKFERPDA